MTTDTFRATLSVVSSSDGACRIGQRSWKFPRYDSTQAESHDLGMAGGCGRRVGGLSADRDATAPRMDSQGRLCGEGLRARRTRHAAQLRSPEAHGRARRHERPAP